MTYEPGQDVLYGLLAGTIVRPARKQCRDGYVVMFHDGEPPQAIGGVRWVASEDLTAIQEDLSWTVPEASHAPARELD